MKTFYFLDGSKIKTIEECRGCFLNNNRINKFLEPIYENERILVCQDMENPIPGFYIISTKEHINGILQMNNILINDIANLIYIVRKGMADIMILNLEIVIVDSDYCDYLRQFDNKVAYNKHKKELRPFIGILFEIDTCKYFAPLSSPKPKHRKMKNMIDFFKIKDGELGAVNFNNMIPVNV